jgi:monoamine oxidase
VEGEDGRTVAARAARVDDPFTRGSYAAFGPGQITRYWRFVGLAEGRVHFAGEHTSMWAQAFLDGAVSSGRRAAREVLARP